LKVKAVELGQLLEGWYIADVKICFFMASKILYPVIAALGIAAASGAAWWYQNKPASAAAEGAALVVTPAQVAASAPAGGASAPRAPTVEVATVEVTKLTDDTQAVGSLRSRQGVTLRPEVSGRITALNFRDGDRVKKGQLMVQFDDQLQLAQVQQSQAELSIAQANHKRNQELVAQNFISKRSVDESSANLEVAQAKLALSKATAARLKVLAPFDGITGIRTANVGDYLKDGADVVNIEDIDAVFVDFRLPERFQNKVKRGQSATVNLDALPGQKFTAFVQAVDPLIDTNGRSVGVRGCIDNRQLRLRPGMFARVTAVFGERESALVVPEEAIVPQGQRVVVYKIVDGKSVDEKIAQRVEVKLGIRRPGRVEVLEGLVAGDQVVTAGQQRLQRDSMPVRVADASRAGGQGGGGQTGGREGPQGVGLGAGPVAGQALQGDGVAAAGPRESASAAASTVPTASATPMPAKGGAGGNGAKVPQGPNPCLAVAAGGSTPGRAPGLKPASAGI
jgi:membrane fusion protein, multidrug efflux system